MFPPFSEDEAFLECKKIINDLETGVMTFEQVTPESESRKSQGIMIGVLIAEDSQKRRIVLKTVSGISKRLVYKNKNLQKENESIFVPPIVSAEDINAALFQNDREIHVLTEKINECKNSRKCENGRFLEQTESEKKLIERRKFLNRESLLNVFSLYSFACADGSEKKLLEICKKKLPPTGTGDCCAPKLLDYAFRNALTPVSMAEVFFGKSTTNKKSLCMYPPCDERCALILPEMLGIRIIYRDHDIVVLDKQSGVLSVPGRGPEKQDCIVNRLKRLFPTCIAQPSVHRLDMETSGLLILAFTDEAHRALNRQFEMRQVHKEYVALLDGRLEDEKQSGEVTLFFRVDIEHRPRQIWDEEYGKKAVTQWQKIDDEEFTFPDGSKKIVSRVRFFPLTGRTHQLRLAAADKRGLNIPIIGDSLYGRQPHLSAVRLMLHAETLEFTHPITGEKMHFNCRAEFD